MARFVTNVKLTDKNFQGLINILSRYCRRFTEAALWTTNPRKKSPEKWSPGKKSPEKRSPEKWSPEKWYFRNFIRLIKT